MLRKKLWREAGPPPDLATRLFSERIMYLGMPIDSSVAELLTAQLFVLVQEAPDPIYFYINSTGIAPLQRLSGMQASDIDIYRKITREKTHTMAKYLALHTKKSEDDIIADFARPRYFTPYEAAQYGLIDTVLEPKDDKNVAHKDWAKMGSDISELGLWDDEEQPLPTNVMYPGKRGTSEYWRSDFD
ncbi:ATP-dependent Clp protease, protease subunit [Haematococcus lacustris]|uniref:ATP-dependent Clp protease proteolytic subunit n=1 Tax=Haematococcus lacustris TaxID=44745 RepID=A0A6A0A0N5_HAELA|nr:ATP-dependent Clp protease, protease subunit [Haematococcus lacustris]